MEYQAFAQGWVRNLMESLEAHLGEQARVEVMEACGRACVRRGPADVARQCRENLEGWLTVLARWHGGEKTVQCEGDKVEVLCADCLCTLVKDGPARLSDTYCACSVGWMKETFEVVLGRPVAVTLVESIKRGGQRCRFAIEW